MEDAGSGLTEPADRRGVRVAVLGSPIGHSLSPVLHNAAYAALGLTWWRYSAIECDEAGLAAFLDSCGPDWAGLSLTMPLKRAVLPLLDRAEPLVTKVGGANTVLFAAERRLGYNTDVPGMVRALAEHGIGARASLVAVAAGGASGAPAGAGTGLGLAGPALVLGAGATAAAALAALRELGETSVAVAVRDPARTDDLRAAADRIGIGLELRPFESASAAGAPLIISTVPAGAADSFARLFTGDGESAGPGAPGRPAAGSVRAESAAGVSRAERAAGASRAEPAAPGALPAVFDVVYHPWPTALAAAALRAGAIVVAGFDLLLHQAAVQVELLTGRPAPLERMRESGLAELARRGRREPG